MKTIFTVIICLGMFLFGFIFISGAVYKVNETEQVVITQFGKPVGNTIVEAGLKWKTPFIQKANKFEKRILEWDGYPNQVPTQDKKYIWLDTTARWRIVDALQFYESLGNEQMAQSRLDDVMDAAARDAITAHVLVEVVRDSNRILDREGQVDNPQDSHVNVPLERIDNGRQHITKVMLNNVKEVVPQFGIEVIDIQIKRINYVEEVREKVFQRMISERQREAEQHRSEGQGEAAIIEGQKQKELQRIESEAYKTAQEIRGKADADAIKIYASVHNKDANFYSFIESLETYKSTINDNTFLILTTDSPLYKYLQDIKR